MSDCEYGSQGYKQECWQTGKGAEQAVDELHPSMKGVEVGVIMAGVVLP